MKAFLRYYLELPYPASTVDAALERLSPEFLDQAAREADLRAMLVLQAGALEMVGYPGSNQISVTIAPGPSGGGVIRRSLTWCRSGRAGSAVLRGDLEVAPLGAERCQLALTAQYQPFAHGVDARARMQAQRIGESTLKAFVDRIAAEIQTLVESGRLPYLRTA